MPLKVVPRRDRKLNRLVKKGEARTLRKGEPVFPGGAAAREVVLVRSGYIRLVARAGTPLERTVALAGPWELAGEEALIPGSHRRTTALAGQETQLTVLDGDAVNRVLRTSDRTFEAFLQAVHDDMALAHHLSQSRGAVNAADRLEALLADLVHRWGRPTETGLRIPARLTHQVLADLSGIHRSTVTTILNDLIYDGVLAQVDGALDVLEPQALTNLRRGESVR